MFFAFSRISSVKPSPSKKSRGGGQGGLRRAPTLGAPTPLSHATGQSDSRLMYHSHFKSTESEADSGMQARNTISLTAELGAEMLVLKSAVTLPSGVQMGRPDLVPRTPPLVDNAADCEANLSTSSLGSTGIASTSPPLR